MKLDQFQNRIHTKIDEFNRYWIHLHMVSKDDFPYERDEESWREEFFHWLKREYNQ
jgi:hypothetical protein